jgi:site-specific DNA-methyltransferase (adenine-specific)
VTVYYEDGGIVLHHGDSLQVLPTLPDASVDAVITDPPYGLEFMGREWDGADGFRRSLNPNDVGRDSVFGRTSAKAPEYRTSGAGQIASPGIGDRPTQWVSNQGWNGYRCANCGHLPHGGSPCACDNPQMVRADNRWPLFQQWCEAWVAECLRVLKPGGHILAFGGSRTWHRLAIAVEDAGFEIRDSLAWIYGSGFPKSLNLVNASGERTGWGTALKPAFEPIVVGRKPLAGTVQANTDRYGTGALNVDACRTTAGPDYAEKCASVVGLTSNRNGDAYGEWAGEREDSAHPAGRWPTNVLLGHRPDCDEGGDCQSGCPVAEMDRQSGITPSNARANKGRGMGYRGADGERGAWTGGDSGGASRFFPVFRYEAKAPKSERPRLADGTAWPTVKPLALMRWLLRLVTPPGGTVLEPFAGSGTTLEAAAVEGFRCIGIERDPQAVQLCVTRLSKPIEPVLFGEVS